MARMSSGSSWARTGSSPSSKPAPVPALILSISRREIFMSSPRCNEPRDPVVVHHSVTQYVSKPSVVTFKYGIR